MTQPSTKTLYVDLDGTLIHSDLLVESCIDMLRRNPLYLLLIPVWLMRGKAWLKHQIARRSKVRVDLLPYHSQFLETLRVERSRGRRLVLISASDQGLVEEVATHLDLFDGIYGSDGEHNLSGRHKLQKIQELESGQAYAYAGNGRPDLEVWAQAKEIIAVGTGKRLRRRLEQTGKPVQHFDTGYDPRLELLRAIRPHQWLKNVLLFAPLLLVQQDISFSLLAQVMIGFISFCLCASSVYLLNDLLDLKADRQHHEKQYRPFARGSLDLRIGLIASPALLGLAFLLAWLFTPTTFVLVLALYYLCTLLYSFLLKRIVLIDVLTLATLYTLRIIAGAAVIPVIPSFWLLAYSMFIFMSLAIVKRYTELIWLRNSGIRETQGRGYLASDLDMMAILGSSAALMSVLVFALYINSDEISRQYLTPEVLWFICPLLLYLFSRIWLLAHRGELEGDPVVFALRDRISQAVVILGVILLYLARFDWRQILLS